MEDSLIKCFTQNINIKLLNFLFLKIDKHGLMEQLLYSNYVNILK